MGRSHDDQLSFDFDAPEPSTRLTPSGPEQDPSDDSPDGRSIHASHPAGSDRQWVRLDRAGSAHFALAPGTYLARRADEVYEFHVVRTAELQIIRID